MSFAQKDPDQEKKDFLEFLLGPLDNLLHKHLSMLGEVLRPRTRPQAISHAEFDIGFQQLFSMTWPIADGLGGFIIENLSSQSISVYVGDTPGQGASYCQVSPNTYKQMPVQTFNSRLSFMADATGGSGIVKVTMTSHVLPYASGTIL